MQINKFSTFVTFVAAASPWSNAKTILEYFAIFIGTHLRSSSFFN